MKNPGLFILFVFLFIFSAPVFGQDLEGQQPEIEKQTFAYVERDSTLYLDLYQRKGDTEAKPCVIFVFGGGFAAGSRDRDFYLSYFEALARSGLKVASIDYRLGLKGIYDQVGIFNTKPLGDAIDMAVEDLYQATAFLLSKAGDLRIDPSRIILSGSSAGAITSLQGDWYNRNGHPLTRILPEGFQYSGVVSFAGAIFSTQGKPEYRVPPAPTLFFHGTEDKTVPYNKRKLLNKGFFGSNYLARQFEKKDYPFHYIRQMGAGHEMATLPMKERLLEILRFIQTAVMQKGAFQVETTLIPLKE